jgi:hypothetical protein
MSVDFRRYTVTVTMTIPNCLQNQMYYITTRDQATKASSTIRELDVLSADVAYYKLLLDT